jgi:cation-transporting ATPase E
VSDQTLLQTSITPISDAPKLSLEGLTAPEVRERIAQGLQNKISNARTKQITEILAENFFSVFNLIVALIIGVMMFFYIRTGDDRLPLDVIGVLGVAIINTALAVVQEIRAKRALDKVNLLLKRTARVVRDGREIEINQAEIVVGDLIALTRGDQIVVDGRIKVGNHLEIDESLLTGESLPIEKQTGDVILSGSFCVAGNGYYVAEKVGDISYAAKITNSAKQFKLYLTPLQRRLGRIVQLLFVTSILLISFEIFFGSNEDLSEVDFIRKLSTLVISLVPHGLILMSSITFALGVYRISQLGAIVQKLNAIESFSNVRVVCTDKTGTLTQNKLAIKHVTRLDEQISQTEIERLLGLYGELSTDKNATLRTLEKFAPAAAEFLRNYVSVKLIDEIPFSSDLKMSLVEVQLNDQNEIFILGGFDVLHAKIGVPGMRGKSEDLLRELGLETYRNLLFGRVLNFSSLVKVRKDLDSLRIDPLCIMSIVDEVRTDVLEAIKLFQLHNIQIKILSGDAAESVQSVAHEIGWQVTPEKIIVGAELDQLDEMDFAQAARENLFLRVSALNIN